jgi:hypothetical protein
MKYPTFPIMLWYLILSASFLVARAPDTSWTKTFGGVNDDNGRWVQETDDGGYIITGITASSGAGQNDAWLIKTDASGNLSWSKTYGGSNQDYGFTVQQTSTGDYVIGGQTSSFGAGGMDAWLITTDSQGNINRTNTYGTSMYELGYSAMQTMDGGYIISSQTLAHGAGQIDIWLIKTDSLGDTVWTKTYGGSDYDWCRFARQTRDSGYVILGQTQSFGAGDIDAYLIKTDAQGNTLWTKTYGGMATEYTHTMQQTTDGGYVIVVTSTLYSAGGYDAWLIKTDPSGDTLWTRTYGGSEQEEGYSVNQTSDGGYIITGYTASFGNGGFDVFVVRTNSFGDTLWTKTMGGPGDDIGYCVQETSDGGYIIVGRTDSYGAGEDDLWLIKLEPDLSGFPPDRTLNLPNHPVLYQNYPNPFNPTTAIEFNLPRSSEVTLKIFNLLGEEVTTLLSAFLPAGSHVYEWDASDLASGIYLYRLQAGDYVETRKTVLTR